MVYRITRIQNSWFKNVLIEWFILKFDVDVTSAANTDTTSYASFNQFFTRSLAPGARPIAHQGDAVVCPADGTISQIGMLSGQVIPQAKGYSFTLSALLANDLQSYRQFEGGCFTTVYLSPRDYHRVHMPITGDLRKMTYVPGRLFSVDRLTTEHVRDLFARNERVISYFDTALGPIALLMVGAIFVGSIETSWHGQVTPDTTRNIQTWRYEKGAYTFQRGSELGRFNMGSTVILLARSSSISWLNNLIPGAPVKMGQMIGRTLSVKQH